MLYLPTKFGFATSWNGRDIEPPINGTQHFTRLCMLRISTPDLTFHPDDSYPALPFNIVDLDFVYEQLLDGHKACKTTLSLTQYQSERSIGLTRILYLSLQNYSTVTMVKTNNYDVNTKCAADTYTELLL